MTTKAYASGNWRVTEGNEEEFVTRWTDFLEWSREQVPGLENATLIRDEQDPRHFVSMATWADVGSRRSWQSHPTFAEKLGACRSLCDGLDSGSFELAALIG